MLSSVEVLALEADRLAGHQPLDGGDALAQRGHRLLGHDPHLPQPLGQAQADAGRKRPGKARLMPAISIASTAGLRTMPETMLVPIGTDSVAASASIEHDQRRLVEVVLGDHQVRVAERLEPARLLADLLGRHHVAHRDPDRMGVALRPRGHRGMLPARARRRLPPWLTGSPSRRWRRPAGRWCWPARRSPPFAPANRSSRVAERSLLATQRPLLMPSRLQDPPLKVGFVDGKWVMSPGGGGVAEADDEAVYLVLSLRNVGTGMAVLHGWQFYPRARPQRDRGAADRTTFHRLNRDLYVPVAGHRLLAGRVPRPRRRGVRCRPRRGPRPRPAHDRRALRRPRGRPAGDQPVHPEPARGRRVDRRRRPPLEHRPTRPALVSLRWQGAPQRPAEQHDHQQRQHQVRAVPPPRPRAPSGRGRPPRRPPPASRRRRRTRRRTGPGRRRGSLGASARPGRARPCLAAGAPSSG